MQTNCSVTIKIGFYIFRRKTKQFVNISPLITWYNRSSYAAVKICTQPAQTCFIT